MNCRRFHPDAADHGGDALPCANPPSARIVIPCYNYGRFVRSAVRSALAQVDARVEIVVVDDGSNDGTSAAACDACRGERVTVMHQKNAGLSAARNRGAAGAATEYLVFLDADDLLEPTFVRELAAVLPARGHAGFDPAISHAYCQQRWIGLTEGVWHVPAWDPLLIMATNIHGPTTLIRREAFEAVGGFDETMRQGYEDWDLWLKFAERSMRAVRVARPLYVWRRHSSTTMITESWKVHDSLYRTLMENHRELFERHGDDLAVWMNTFLRRHDLNWLDETGYPRELQYLWSRRDAYEAMVCVRLHHALHRAVRAMPGPLARGARLVLTSLKRAMAGRKAG